MHKRKTEYILKTHEDHYRRNGSVLMATHEKPINVFIVIY